MDRVIVANMLKEAIDELNDDAYLEKVGLLIERLSVRIHGIEDARGLATLDTIIDLASSCITDTIEELKAIHKHLGGDPNVWEEEKENEY